ncbi:MAG: tRNA 4-thiouridine(8) synthase ThiI [Clostridia bacterium]|nr:tRNA 4-thiouridine(8) synthase ThiI [Clostridia bacterium]
MKEIILAKCGELVLKGLNRSSFEKTLIRNIKRALQPLGEFDVSIMQSTIYIDKDGGIDDTAAAFSYVRRVFGIAALCRAAVCRKDMEDIKKTALEYSKNALQKKRTFKVESKRSDKRFAFSSPQICADVGAYLLKNIDGISVDVHNPDVVVTVEVRDLAAYVHCENVPGAGGMPYGSSGKACLLLSGGIDSPVAGYMMAKRGLKLSAVHFFSPPYTGELAKQKVFDLASQLSCYCPDMELYLVHFTEIQEQIKKNCREDLFTVIMRRFMIRLADAAADKSGAGALITGESLGQVASQTLRALSITDELSRHIVLRPLIGMDKDEIVAVSRKIDTFETSILPYEDCCTVFTPRHPKTRPVLSEILEEENKLDIPVLVENAVSRMTVVKID